MIWKGTGAMIEPLTKKVTDHSDAESFLFSFFCDRCGREWRSRTWPFEHSEAFEIEKDEARRLLWADEHRTAFNEANLEARMNFNQCGKCGSWVCDDCFRPLGSDKHDLCLDCLEAGMK
jgi:hypothetical protein